MEKTGVKPDEMRKKVVLDRDEQEVGRVQEVERDLRTGRYSTLRVEVNPKLVGKVGCGKWPYLPIDVSRVERNDGTIRLRENLEELNRQFCGRVNINKKEFDPSEFIEKPAIDRDNTSIGTVKDFRATTNHGEFPTVMIELRDSIKSKYTSGTISGVRVRTDRIEHVGTEVKLNASVGDLSKEWNEVTVQQ